MFINSILQNSEVWYNMTEDNINQLEKLDNILLRKIFEVGQSVPTAFLHLELGTLPIRFIIKTRRILYLQYLLKQNENSLLFRFLNAQMEDPKTGDWWLLVKKDLEEIKLNLSLHDIKSMSSDKLKDDVKKSVKVAAFKWLSDKKAKSKKVKDIHHGWLETEKYISNPILTINQSKLLFSLRSRMIFVRENYPNMQRENSCPFCSTEENPVSDSQEHLLECEYLKSTDSELCHLDGKYDDIFSENQVKQANMTILLESKYNARKKILENLVKQSNS